MDCEVISCLHSVTPKLIGELEGKFISFNTDLINLHREECKCSKRALFYVYMDDEMKGVIDYRGIPDLVDINDVFERFHRYFSQDWSIYLKDITRYEAIFIACINSPFLKKTAKENDLKTI